VHSDPPTQDEFRRVLRCRADTVHLITYRTASGSIEGMTATSVAALSMAPPSILVCVGHTSRARDNIRREGSFGVSILSTIQRELAATAGRTGSDKALAPDILVATDPTLTPVLKDALGSLQCKLADDREVYTHTVFVGQVMTAAAPSDGEPLLHYLGTFAELARPSR